MVDHGTHRTLRLRQLRLSRSMTQQDVAARLERLAVLVEQRHVGVNADMVSKWERGQKQPSVFYVRLLALLFDVSPGQLAEPARPEDVAETPQGPGSVDVLDLLACWTGIPHRWSSSSRRSPSCGDGTCSTAVKC
ncbi:helix-turn-helix domain-containing protein [Nocardioides ungokensis]|uniref:helix-turn-helix domain-containing protein n=1 Tax=Nocardioides ungokensis TaxID=1643322 RepID=UPI0015E04765